MEARSSSGLLLAACLILGAPAASQEAAGSQSAAPPTDPSGLSETEEHQEHLDRLVGDWELAVKVWTEPGGEPVEAAGTAEARWILDGRFVHTVYRTELFGQPFEAWSIDGYDEQEQEYVGTWRDTQGSYTLIYRGQCKKQEPVDEEEAEERVAGCVRTMKAQITDPVSQEKLRLEAITTVGDADTFTFESFVVLSEEDRFKNMELTARRQPVPPQSRP